MFNRILLPVDLTEKHEAALEAAKELLGAGGEIILLHVIETIADAPFEDMQDFYSRLEEKASSAMADLAAALAGEELSVAQHISYGKRAAEIVSFADDRQVELIVMSSRQLDPEKPETAWGSIGHQVAILSRCPVLLLK